MDPGEGEFWGTFMVRIARWQDAIELQLVDNAGKPVGALYLKDGGVLSSPDQLYRQLWHGSIEHSEYFGGPE